MSKTKAMTMQYLKDKEKKIILSHTEYIIIIDRIAELQDMVEKNIDEGNIQTAENIFFNNEACSISKKS